VSHPLGHRDCSASIRPEPAVNEDDEAGLRKQLESAGNLPQSSACNRVLELEQKHGLRREWVWARMGSSPWAYALFP